MKLRLFPKSVGGQILAMLLLAIVVTQAVSLLLLTHERNRAVRAALGLEAAGRAANVAMLLDDAPEVLYSSILRSADSPLVRFSIGTRPETDRVKPESANLVGRIRAIMGASDREVRVDIKVAAMPNDSSTEGMSPEMGRMHSAMLAERIEPEQLTLAIQLSGGNWLNVQTMFHHPDLQWSSTDLLPLAMMALAVAMAVWLTDHRVVGPMRRLAVSAEKLGRGLGGVPLPVSGPREVRDTTQAFNRMQSRLTRFVGDRTLMLAALSHDLRSPLTAMRLRLELLDDSDDSDRLKALVAEMQAMVEATLDFARGEAKTEPSVLVDLAQMLAELVADAATGGAKVAMVATASLCMQGRPVALRRAFRNLIDNAIRYGGGGEVELSADHDMAAITITDRGTGLPENQLSQVFEPFVRLETSRSRDTGGVGLGLAIARTVIQAHGGEISLANHPEGGLVATIQIPLATG